MVIATEFLDPFDDNIVAFPVREGDATEWYANIIELIVGAVVFLSIVAIYNALFSIWERLLRRRTGERAEQRDLEETDDVLVRVTYAILVVALAFLIVWYLGPTRGRFSRAIRSA
jgi:hypothetical protein